jgi:biopolymer transport protein TolR
MGMGVPTSDDPDDDGRYRPMAEINITPMVDVMLVLLVIFMVAAPLMVAGVPVDLPRTSAARVSMPKKPMVVTLTADGMVQIREEQIAKTELVNRLLAIRAAEGDNVVYVRSDKASHYGDVMELLGRIGEAGYQRLSLLSQPQPSASAAPAGVVK